MVARPQCDGPLVYVFVAPGFDEVATIPFVGRLREANISVQIVGIKPGLMAGEHGIAVQTDLVVSQLPDWIPTMVALPNGRRSLNRLLIDPQLNRLIEATVDEAGYLIGLGDVQATLLSSGCLSPVAMERLIMVPDLSAPNAVQPIVNLLL